MLYYSVLSDVDRQTVDITRESLVQEILHIERLFYRVSAENVRLKWKLLVESIVQFFLVNKVLNVEKNSFSPKELLETTKLDQSMWRYVSSAKVMLTPLWMSGARLSYLFNIAPEEEKRIQNIINIHEEEIWHHKARQIFDFFAERIAHREEGPIAPMSYTVEILERVAKHLCDAFKSLQKPHSFQDDDRLSRLALEKITYVLINRFVVIKPPELEPFVVEDNFT